MLEDLTTQIDPTEWYSSTDPELHNASVLDWIETVCFANALGGRDTAINLRNLLTYWTDSGLPLSSSKIYIPFSEISTSIPSSDTDNEPYELALERLRDRKVLLHESYPFHLSDQLASIKFGCESLNRSFYTHLLLLCAIEGYGRRSIFTNITKSDHNFLRSYFESIVLHSLRQHGYDCEQIGTGAGSAKFDQRLTATLRTLGIGSPQRNTEVRQKIKDGGADIIAGHFWKDGRSREIVHLVQCTVSQPHEWFKKISEPSQSRWIGLINQGCPGIPCLATPYEAQSDARSTLDLQQPHSYFDRIRLSIAAKDADISKLPNYNRYIDIIKKGFRKFGDLDSKL